MWKKIALIVALSCICMISAAPVQAQAITSRSPTSYVGNFNPTVTYAKGDIVYYMGYLFASLVTPNFDHLPYVGDANEYWIPFSNPTTQNQIQNAFSNQLGILMENNFRGAQVRHLRLEGEVTFHTTSIGSITSCGSWTKSIYSSNQTLIVSGTPGITSCTWVFANPHASQSFCTANGSLQSAGAIGIPISTETPYSVVFTFSSTQTGFTATCFGGRLY
jgi:hypothetical protein